MVYYQKIGKFIICCNFFFMFSSFINHNFLPKIFNYVNTINDWTIVHKNLPEPKLNSE